MENVENSHLRGSLGGPSAEVGEVAAPLILTVSFIESLYVFAGICFMYALKGLGHPETARRGNMAGQLGMLTAISASLMSYGSTALVVKALVAFVAAGVLGVRVALQAEMIMMPQLVAGFHAMVGLAAILVALARYYEELMNAGHLFETAIGLFFGGLTLTGSIVACGKLHGVISSKPLLLPGRHFLNFTVLVLSGVAGWRLKSVEQWSGASYGYLWAETALALFLGWSLVMGIGGGDAPVLISLLNSTSGWTTVAAGFMLDNSLLVIAGCLIGSSGAVLSYVMCVGMNRSFISVLLGGFGGEAAPGGAAGTTAEAGEVSAVNASEAGEILARAKSVVIVPGYGMAVARCQNEIAGVAEVLKKANVAVSFGIHPVAGRLPGHMNVLLAEANVPYNTVYEMEKINEDLEAGKIDVVLVCGANDIVNPIASEDLSSPIGGMPVLEVWKANQACIVMKRSMATGFAGVDNPLFVRPKTKMLFGDAKATAQELLVAVKSLATAAAAAGAASASTTGAGSSLLEPLLSKGGPSEASASIMVASFPTALKTVGVVKESAGETRVAVSPNIVGRMRKSGFAVVVEREAGQLASFPDRLYAGAGAELAESAAEVFRRADIVVRVGQLGEQDIALARGPGQTIIGYVWGNQEILKRLAAKGVSVLAMEAVPRSTKAQKLDTLSSMANMAGYKAVIEAFHHLPRFSKPLTTAAGQVQPARVLILGCGVAGLSAIGTAKSLGAVVQANDTRSVVKEQVESMGAEFLQVQIKEEGEGAGGYAKEMSEAFVKAQMDLYAKAVAGADVVITTAQIPGKPAPRLVTAQMVRRMKPGSVIVDLAAQQGGNVELTVKNQVVVDAESGVTLIGITNLPASMPAQASELYAANVANLIDHIKGAANFDKALEHPDEILAPMRLVFRGTLVPPPPVAPLAAAPPPAAAAQKKPAVVKPAAAVSHKGVHGGTGNRGGSWVQFGLTMAGLLGVFVTIGCYAGAQTIQYTTVLVLSVVVGYFLVWSVDPALHTPLMSVTNAVSGIIVLGALVQLGASSLFAEICAFLGVFCAGCNVFGGFLITHRMLSMFRK